MDEPVKPERSGWRDEKLSRRHRKWGFNCPMVDIDLLALEYDAGRPSAVVEYKHEKAPPQFPSHASYRAIGWLATAASVPFMAVRYSDDLDRFRVVPLNSHAKAYLSGSALMTEREYVGLLYRLRGRDVPNDLFDNWDVEV